MKKSVEISIGRKFLNLKTLISFLIAIFIFYAIFAKFDITQVIGAIKGINIPYFVLAAVLFLLVFPLSALRWRIFLRNLGTNNKLKELTEITVLSWFANNIVPAKIGDLYKGYLMRKNYNFPISKAMGTIFMERLVDMIFIAIFIFISGLAIFKWSIPKNIMLPLIVLFILILTAVGALFFMNSFQLWLFRIVPKRLKHIAENFHFGLLNCVKLREAHIIILYTILSWLVQAVSVFFVIKALNLNMPVFLIIFITLANALLTAVPITPGGLGVGEAAIAGILISFRMEYSLAMLTSILIRVITYWIVLIFGGALYLASARK